MCISKIQNIRSKDSLWPCHFCPKRARQNTACWGDGGKGADVVVSANTAKDTYVALLGGAWWSTHREMVGFSDFFRLIQRLHDDLFFILLLEPQNRGTSIVPSWFAFPRQTNALLTPLWSRVPKKLFLRTNTILHVSKDSNWRRLIFFFFCV